MLSASHKKFAQGNVLTRNSDRAFHYALVVIQFGTLLMLALSGPIVASGFWLWVEIGAVALGVWAIVAMRVGNFNITPDPKSDSQLTLHGPYNWIRHPMYSALILLGLALVGNHITLLRFVLWLVLVVNLTVKLTVEERLLLAHFPTYAHYRRQTWRLLPFCY